MKVAFLFSCVCSLGLFSSMASADLNSDISAACATGGSVTIPPTVTVTATINLRCSGSSPALPVRLKGSPSLITCQTGASPCIVVGGTSTAQRANLSMEGIYLNGPGRSTSGSEGIRFLATADEAMANDIRIDNFDVGIHFVATGSDLLYGDYVSHALIGTLGLPSSTSTNIAVHLEGAVANVKFDQFHLAGWQRVILMNGQGLSGADATFSNGDLNLTKTPGIAAVYVDTSDVSGHMLNMSNIQDWETETPYLEVGNKSYVTIVGIGFSGHPFSSGIRPAFRVLPAAAGARLHISNSWLFSDSSDGSKLVVVENPLAYVNISDSHIQGGVQFLSAASASLTGNQCDWPGAYGQISNVRLAGNVGFCPDR